MELGDIVLAVAIMLGKSLLMLVALLVFIAYALYADRKVWAAVQLRKGPNVVGPWGLLQSFADFLKYIVKEIVVPAGADKAVFFLAPMISFVLPVIVWAVIPWAPGWVISDMNVSGSQSRRTRSPVNSPASGCVTST